MEKVCFYCSAQFWTQYARMQHAKHCRGYWLRVR